MTAPHGVGGVPQSIKAQKARMIKYDMRDFLESCVHRYQELAGPKFTRLRHVETPFIDESKEEFDINDKSHENLPDGQLQPIAAKVLMKILYAARTGRYDLLRG